MSSFYETDNDNLLFYRKASRDRLNILFVIVNLDPFNTQAGTVHVPLDRFGINPGSPYLVHDLLSEDKFIWQGERNRIELDPRVQPARIFRVVLATPQGVGFRLLHVARGGPPMPARTEEQDLVVQGCGHLRDPCQELLRQQR